MVTTKQLKLDGKSIPKGWRRMRYGELFDGCWRYINYRVDMEWSDVKNDYRGTRLTDYFNSGSFYIKRK